VPRVPQEREEFFRLKRSQDKKKKDIKEREAAAAAEREAVAAADLLQAEGADPDVVF
jgi:hypothetical protein